MVPRSPCDVYDNASEAGTVKTYIAVVKTKAFKKDAQRHRDFHRREQP
jgi:hypothetical protein